MPSAQYSPAARSVSIPIGKSGPFSRNFEGVWLNASESVSIPIGKSGPFSRCWSRRVAGTLCSVSIPIGKSGPFSRLRLSEPHGYSIAFQSPSGSQALLAVYTDDYSEKFYRVSIPIGKSGPFSRAYLTRHWLSPDGFNPHREVRPF